jgi:hypothetical protein
MVAELLYPFKYISISNMKNSRTLHTINASEKNDVGNVWKPKHT